MHVLQLVFIPNRLPNITLTDGILQFFFPVGCTHCKMLILTSNVVKFGFYFPYRKLRGNLLGRIMSHFTGEGIRASCSCYILPRLPVVDVVVLPSPAPVLVREAVDLQKLFFTEA